MFLAQWELHAGVKPEDRRTTPLFCGPEGVGTPLKGSALDEIFFRMMSYVLRDEAQAKKYSIQPLTADGHEKKRNTHVLY